jgi:hypothetical protein
MRQKGSLLTDDAGPRSPDGPCGARQSARLAASLQAWLGHKNIQHTVRYTELSPHRFKDFWR